MAKMIQCASASQWQSHNGLETQIMDGDHSRTCPFNQFNGCSNWHAA